MYNIYKPNILLRMYDTVLFSSVEMNTADVI